MNIDRRCDSYSKPLRTYYNEIVQCGGKRGGSVKIEQTGCVTHLGVYEMKVYGTALLAIGKYYIILYYIILYYIILYYIILYYIILYYIILYYIILYLQSGSCP